MANTYLNPAWKAEQETKLRDETTHYELITAINTAKKYIILRLATLNRPFKMYQMGAGVVRITTETEVCPCCKKKL